MIRCHACGKESHYAGRCCPACGAPYTFTEEDIRALTATVSKAKRKTKEEAAYTEACHVLSDLGYPDGVRRYGEILLSVGEGEAALALYKAHAHEDGTVAYRLGKLLLADKPEDGLFWLLFAATVYGTPDAYPLLGNLFTERREDEYALHFYRLGAAFDSKQATLALARRYADGIGVEKNEAYAKWYLLRLPMHLFADARLTFRLRRVSAEEPPLRTESIPTSTWLCMLAEAGKGQEPAAYFRVMQKRAERGDISAVYALSNLYLYGEGCPQDVNHGLKILLDRAKSGDTTAAMRLGDLYLKGHPVEKNTECAVSMYATAADFGDPRGYERIGDMYRAGMDGKPDIARAIRYYENAVRLGGTDAARKVSDLKTQRESFYERGMKERTVSPADAYRHFVAAANMGYTPAEVRIGDCYLAGTGVSQDRRRAYLWYNHAAEQKEPQAYFPLGLCYARGVGTRFDFRKAVYNLRLAEASGVRPAHDEAVRLLEGKRKKMFRQFFACLMELLYQKKMKVARELLEGAAPDIPSGKILYLYAVFCDFGIGAPSNISVASAYYAAAAEAGFTDDRGQMKKAVLKLVNRTVG